MNHLPLAYVDAMMAVALRRDHMGAQGRLRLSRKVPPHWRRLIDCTSPCSAMMEPDSHGPASSLERFTCLNLVSLYPSTGLIPATIASSCQLRSLSLWYSETINASPPMRVEMVRNRGGMEAASEIQLCNWRAPPPGEPGYASNSAAATSSKLPTANLN